MTLADISSGEGGGWVFSTNNNTTAGLYIVFIMKVHMAPTDSGTVLNLYFEIYEKSELIKS